MDEAVDRAIDRIARRQGGFVKRVQLIALGLSAKQIDYRIRIGRLIPVYRGVYAVGHLPRLPVDRAHGALLASGQKSALSSSVGLEPVELLSRLEVPVRGRRRLRTGVRAGSRFT